MRRNVVVVVAALAFATVACSSRAPSVPSAGGTTPAVTVTPPPGGDASTPGATTTQGRGGSAAKPGGGSPAPSPTQSVAQHLDAVLDKPCVHRGVAGDPQGLTVRTTPDSGVNYISQYSDGSTVATHPELGAAGSGGGFTHASGTFRVTWIVPAAAPLFQFSRGAGRPGCSSL